jgi:uncharacterized protein with von Willebrand factor type A (vWA) domain
MEQIGRPDGADAVAPSKHVAEQRRQLDEMMRSLFLKDERLEAEMRQLGMQSSEALPLDEMVRQYRFRGDDEVDMREAMQLMEDLAQMEDLEQQVRRAQNPKDIDKIDPAAVERLLGPEAARDLERLREIAKKLEEAGYLERQGDRLQAHCARHPQDRRQGAPRRLRTLEAGSVRPPRRRAPRRGR